MFTYVEKKDRNLKQTTISRRKESGKYFGHSVKNNHTIVK